MSKTWLAVSLASFLIAVLALAGGLLVPRLLPFTENVIAEVFGLFAAFGLAIVLIEGRILTQQSRRRRVVIRAAKSTLELNGEIGGMVAWELGSWLVSALDSPVDLEGVASCSKDITLLLRRIYDEAERVEEVAIPDVQALSYEDHKARVESVKQYALRVRGRMEVNLAVHEMLLELDESFEGLERCLTEAMWVTVRSEVDRFHNLGRIGNAILRCMEASARLHERL